MGRMRFLSEITAPKANGSFACSLFKLKDKTTLLFPELSLIAFAVSSTKVTWSVKESSVKSSGKRQVPSSFLRNKTS